MRALLFRDQGCHGSHRFSAPWRRAGRTRANSRARAGWSGSQKKPGTQAGLSALTMRSVGLVSKIQPAGEIVREIAFDAEAILRRLSATTATRAPSTGVQR